VRFGAGTDIDSHGDWVGHVRSPVRFCSPETAPLLTGFFSFFSLAPPFSFYRSETVPHTAGIGATALVNQVRSNGAGSACCDAGSSGFFLSWTIMTLSYETFPLSGAKTRGACQCNSRIRDVRSSDTRPSHVWCWLFGWDDEILQPGRLKSNAYQDRFFYILFFFYEKISSIQDELRRFDSNVSRIADLHNRSLNNTDEALSQQNAAALDELVEETRALSNQIKNQIQDLEKESLPPGQDPRIRRNQASRTLRRRVYVFAQTFCRRPPSSVQNSSKLYRTISR